MAVSGSTWPLVPHGLWFHRASGSTGPLVPRGPTSSSPSRSPLRETTLLPYSKSSESPSPSHSPHYTPQHQPPPLNPNRTLCPPSTFYIYILEHFIAGVISLKTRVFCVGFQFPIFSLDIVMFRRFGGCCCCCFVS